MEPTRRLRTLCGVVAAILGTLGVVAASREVLWLAGSDAAPLARLASGALLAIELVLVLFAATLLLAARAPRPEAPPLPDAATMPRVDLLVPVRDEDPGVLAETLAAIAHLRHAPGGLRVVVADDSTDESTRAHNAKLAHEYGARHVTRAHRTGYKAGALNHALRSCDAPYVAVLDVDHAPEPDFLRIALAGFADDEPKTAAVQTRLSWRNADAGIRRLAGILQDQFYGVIQWDRAARGRAVFAGSAAVFRRDALDDVGGFPEATLVEDFDLTILLQTSGWRIAYDDRIGARGLLPWTGRDIARQLWRWSHGTTRALRLRAGRILRAPLPFGHRLELLTSAAAYLAGGLFALAGVLLALSAHTGALPPARASLVPLALLAPAAILVAHVWTAALGARRAGHAPDWRVLVPYHVVTLAFTPVLTGSSLAGLVTARTFGEGRVSKDIAIRSSAGALPWVAGLTAALGVALITSATVQATLGSAGWIWTLELGLVFVLPLAVWGHGANAASGPTRASVDTP